jgi:hypothetical protein
MHTALTVDRMRIKSTMINQRKYFNANLVLVTCIIFGLTQVFALDAFGDDGCERTWSFKTSSPDGTWIAEVHKDICDAGLGVAQEEVVEVRARGIDRSRTVVLMPSGQWTKPEEVTLRWLDKRILEISVPNRTTFSSSISRVKDVEIKVVYKNDDPADRARWLAWQKDYIEWVNQRRSGPRPQPPPLP